MRSPAPVPGRTRGTACRGACRRCQPLLHGGGEALGRGQLPRVRVEAPASRHTLGAHVAQHPDWVCKPLPLFDQKSTLTVAEQTLKSPVRSRPRFALGSHWLHHHAYAVCRPVAAPPRYVFSTTTVIILALQLPAAAFWQCQCAVPGLCSGCSIYSVCFSSKPSFISQQVAPGGFIVRHDLRAVRARQYSAGQQRLCGPDMTCSRGHRGLCCHPLIDRRSAHICLQGFLPQLCRRAAPCPHRSACL